MLTVDYDLLDVKPGHVFLDAGCKVGEASCAACLGGPVDTFGRVNRPLKCISATNRNFPGRMGHKESQVFLASPSTVAVCSSVAPSSAGSSTAGCRGGQARQEMSPCRH